MKKYLFTVISVVISIQLVCLPYGYAARPLTTDDAGTVEKGVFQLEAGLDVARQDNHDREYSPSLTLAYGSSDRLDLGIGIGYLFVRPDEGKNEDGFGDTEVKMKYRLLDEKRWLPALTIAGKLKIPTASDKKGLGSGEADFGLNGIATKGITKRLVFHTNLGYTFIGEDGVNNEMNYSLASQFLLTEKWSLVGEIGGVNNFNGRKGDDPFSALFGTYYLITKDIVWDAGIEVGMNSAAPDFRLTTGLTLFF